MPRSLSQNRNALLFLWISLLTILLALSSSAAAEASSRPRAQQTFDRSYENAVLTEDVTWRGSVLVRGSLVVPPHITLRIEPGAVVRFAASGSRKARLTVLGRLHCNGSAERPVTLTSEYSEAEKGDWGGIQFISSEKRNLLEQCRIEGTETAIDARFSTVTAKGVTVLRSAVGILLRDATATLTGLALSGCETGLELFDSEAELQEGTISGNRSGISAARSGLVLAKLAVRGNEGAGAQLSDCRIRISSCEFEGNGSGVDMKGGEGQVVLSRFLKNREIGLHLAGARVRVSRSIFADNQRDALRMDDGRAIVWGSAFTGNGGYNLAAGEESVAAVQNWWGSNDGSAIYPRISGRQVLLDPWLPERPAVLP